MGFWKRLWKAVSKAPEEVSREEKERDGYVPGATDKSL